MLRKSLVKLFARVGCARLPPRIATWQYQRGSRSLVDNLRAGPSKDESEVMADGQDRSNPMRDLFRIPD